jgi:hypothetical protein
MSQEKTKAPEVYSGERKLAAVKRLLAGESARAVAEELGIRRGLLYKWKDRYALLGEAGLLASRVGRPRKQEGRSVDPQGSRGELLAARKRIAELERKVGQQSLELDFFEGALRHIAAVRKEQDAKRSADGSLSKPPKAD